MCIVYMIYADVFTFCLHLLNSCMHCMCNHSWIEAHEHTIILSQLFGLQVLRSESMLTEMGLEH